MIKLDRENIDDILALTPVQEGMLYHFLEDRRSARYFEQLSVGISGGVDSGCFGQAWNSVADTNEMLRTLFRWEKLKEPTQVVLKEHRVNIRYYDLSAEDEAGDSGGRKKRLAEIKIKDRQETFDLRDVPFRITLCKIGETTYEMIISNHHILYDGWSTGIILKEFFTAYHDFSRDKTPLKAEKNKFKTFIQWLKNRDSGEESKFWREYLAGFGNRVEIPVKKGKKEKVNKVETHGLRFSKDIKEGLEIAVKDQGTTPAVFLYSAWGLLLQKYTGSSDVLFGTTVSGRDAKINGIEDMVGLFINTVPLRVRTHPGEKAADLLQRLNRSLHIRERYENTPPTDIKEYSQWGRGEPHDELFDSIVVIENYPLDHRLGEPAGDLSLHSYAPVEMTHYDLTVIITVFDEIEVRVVYNNSFAGDTIARLSVHFKCIVEDMIKNPGKEIAGIEIITAEEKNEILYSFNRPAIDYPGDKTIHELFVEQAEKTPDNIAVVDAAVSSLTYKALNEKSGGLAHLLIERGVLADSIVGIMMERSVEMIIGIFGILKAGAAYLPIDPNYPEARKQYMLHDSGAVIILATGDTGRESFKKVRVRPCSSVAKKSLAYIIYTSGSTGKPKGVMVNHAPAVNILWALQKEYPLTAADVYLLKTSYVFDVSVAELFGWFRQGGRLAILETGAEKEPKKILDTIQRGGVTHINFVPSMFSVFVDTLERENIDKLSSLKYIFLAGEALLPGLVDRFRRLGTAIALENIYGPTEGTVYASRFSLRDWQNSETVPIGKPMQNIGLYIFDNYNQLQPVGVPGELCIEGTGVARGYLNNPKLTAEKFCLRRAGGSFEKPPPARRRHKLYKTGDLCCWLEDGNIEFLGRMDNQVKIRGFRVELAEIENRLSRHPFVKQAVVILRGHRSGDMYLCAYIAVGRGAHGAGRLENYREYLSRTLPDYMVPAYFVELEALPLTPTGKVNRGELPEPEIVSAVQYAAPRDEKEALLVELWSDVLGIDGEKIGIADNFFILGGHSLKATRLMGRIHKAFDVEIPVAALFQTPTIKGLAEYIKAAAAVGYRALETVEKREYYPLSHAQKRLFLLQRLAPESTAYNMTAVMLLEGKAEKENFEPVFKKLIARHDSLRTSFHMPAEEPVQKIHKEVEFEVDNKKFLRGPGDSRRVFIKRAPGRRRHFELTHAPLFRVELMKIDVEKHILMVDMHHIISDGTSIAVLVKDFMALYSGEDLAPLRIQYKDFCLWQDRREEAIKPQEEYWLGEFAGEIPRLDLPVDFSGPVIRDFSGSTTAFDIAQEETEKLQHLALNEGATLYMVLLSLFYILMAKISGREEIVVGSPAAGRKHRDLEGIIGMFVNTLALRNYPAGEKTFKEFLREVKTRTLGAQENQDYPFEDLVKKVAPHATNDTLRVRDVTAVCVSLCLANDSVGVVRHVRRAVIRHRFHPRSSSPRTSFHCACYDIRPVGLGNNFIRARG